MAGKKFTELCRHIKYRILGRYLGQWCVELYKRMNRVFESKSGEVLIHKTDCTWIRGKLVNYTHGEGFILWPTEGMHVEEPSIAVHPGEISESYLVK